MDEIFMMGALIQKIARIKPFQKWVSMNPLRSSPMGSMKKEAIKMTNPK